jgi:arsenite-transporting ATPase
VVDTAPTGHTLRLLAMPGTLRRIAAVLSDMQAKHRFLSESLGGGYRADVTDALIDELDAEGRGLAELLRDARRCTFSWVLLPEILSLEEARDGVAALDAAGITVNEIIVNGVTTVPDPRCAVCAARARAEAESLAAIRASFPGRPLRFVPTLPHEPRGPAALRRLTAAGRATAPACGRRPPTRAARAADADVRGADAAGGDDWLSVLAPPGRTLLLFGGKGGVGKTTCAGAAALALAAREPRRRVLLLSTDPAHSLSDVLGLEIGDRERRIPGAPGDLVARELDADRAFAARRDRYRDAVDELFNALLGGSRFDIAFDRVVVRELIDLAPPGLDELFAVLTVIEALRPRGPAGEDGGHDVVIVDTAPTGHTVRLLQMPETALQWVHALLAILLKYRKVIGLGELAADLVEVARDLRELATLLRDPVRAGFVAVTRPTELARLETGRLLARLGELGIPVPALVVNRITRGACARCAAAARREMQVAKAVATALADGCAMIVAPALPVPPRGADALTRWGRTWTISDP